MQPRTATLCLLSVAAAAAVRTKAALHVRPSLGTAGVALQKIASRGLEKMGSSGGGRLRGLVREDSMSLVSANSNDNFDEPSQEEFSQPPAWVAQSGGVQDRLPAYHTTL